MSLFPSRATSKVDVMSLGKRPTSALSNGNASVYSAGFGDITTDATSGNQMMKMMMVFFAPVFAVIAMTAAQLGLNISNQSIVESGFDSMQMYTKVDIFLSSLSLERTYVALFVASGGYNLEALGQLDAIIDRVQQELEDVQQYLHIQDDLAETMSEWQEMRLCIYSKCENITSDYVIEFYGGFIKALVNAAERVIEIPQQSKQYAMWAAFVSVSALNKVANYLSIEQALVTVAMTYCQVSDELMNAISENEGSLNSLLRLSLNFYPDVRQSYDKEVRNSTFMSGIQHDKSLVLDGVYIQHCPNMSQHEMYINIRNVITDYNVFLDWLKDIKLKMISEINTELSDLKSGSKVSVSAYAVIMVTVTVLCVFMSFWYANSINKMLENMQKYASSVSSKIKDLNTEKKRADYLLQQMLPKSVVEKLALGEQVLPELYDSVTIYFSDIDGFEDISAQSTPHQVVEMLNGIYKTFDECLECYDVYKVETIRDSYMVASGLPVRCIKHVAEIGHMAMELMLSVADYRISHLPQIRLKLRIGMHSGSCVTGVVGMKMPRYCLFGDTVNVASRMQTNGKPNQIHISSQAKASMESIGGYHFTERGRISIKGKGEMTTYWLNGCLHTPNFDATSLESYRRAHQNWRSVM